MKSTLIILGLLLCSSTFASFEQAPPSFRYKTADAVYVDFQTAHYNISYDVDQKRTTVESTIVFDAPHAGFPLFDLIENPQSVMLDGARVESEAIRDPDQQTTFRVIKQAVPVGTHTLEIRHTLTTRVSYQKGKVASAFFTSDLTDRHYLEQYLPTSFEYDQYAMKIEVEVVGNAVDHSLMTNGRVKKIGKNKFEVEYPHFYTCSSLYFHLLPTDSAAFKTFEFKSIDGRVIPMQIYSNSVSIVDSYAALAVRVLNELEHDYAPFPHEKIVIYGAGSGGMEYSGATIASISALSHELFHSYHARALMPANGNAGWMDEAIAVWRDPKYPLVSHPSFSIARMAGHSAWSRMTDTDAYSKGAEFLAWVANRMNQKNLSFKTFLKDYFNQYKYTTVTTELFRDALISYSGIELKNDFRQYVYGKSQMPNNELERLAGELDSILSNPEHPKLSEDELNQLLWPEFQ